LNFQAALERGAPAPLSKEMVPRRFQWNSRSGLPTWGSGLFFNPFGIGKTRDKAENCVRHSTENVEEPKKFVSRL
jgi:hypothetical protein